MGEARCNGCRRRLPAHELGDTHRCRDCDCVFGVPRYLHDCGPTRPEFMFHPDRLARIKQYEARAELKLPLFG